MTDVYILGVCPCGGRMIAPVLWSKHMKPHPVICEASGVEFCTRLPPAERVQPPPPPERKFIMETR